MLDKVGGDDAVRRDGSQTDLASVRGIILAGAYPRSGSALDRLSPRPLLPVAQQPLIMYSLRWLSRAGVREATICVNNAARAVREHLDAGVPGLNLTYLEDWTPRGAAGCVRDAAMGTDARTLVVIDGTTVPTVDLPALLAAHRRSRAVVTVVVGRENAAGGAENERLRPTGLYVFDRSVTAFVPEEGFQDIKEQLIPRLYQEGEAVSTFSVAMFSPRVVDNESYLALNHWAVERTTLSAEHEDGFRASGDALVHDTASVHPGARLLGPIVLGPNVSVQSGATVVGPSSIGAGSVVGRGAVVARSVILNRCLVGDGAFVDRSTLADEAAVSSRATVYSEMRVSSGLGRGGHQPTSAVPPARGSWSPVASFFRPPLARPR